MGTVLLCPSTYLSPFGTLLVWAEISNWDSFGDPPQQPLTWPPMFPDRSTSVLSSRLAFQSHYHHKSKTDNANLSMGLVVTTNSRDTKLSRERKVGKRVVKLLGR
eukprot:GHVN01031581.1.p1 GENE.GHVN01031581.1~~GHVN01031581.1.p1  ORF type:complete len:105 (-),score=0.77 GHVN01031581.1:52-366(-)